MTIKSEHSLFECSLNEKNTSTVYLRVILTLVDVRIVMRTLVVTRIVLTAIAKIIKL